MPFVYDNLAEICREKLLVWLREEELLGDFSGPCLKCARGHFSFRKVQSYSKLVRFFLVAVTCICSSFTTWGLPPHIPALMFPKCVIAYILLFSGTNNYLTDPRGVVQFTKQTVYSECAKNSKIPISTIILIKVFINATLFLVSQMQ